jgi:hypothetical protein
MAVNARDDDRWQELSKSLQSAVAKAIAGKASVFITILPDIAIRWSHYGST